MRRLVLSTRIDSNKLATSLATWGLFILFPGFMIYHTLLAMGVIPAFIAGLFGPVSAIYFILFLALLPFTYKKNLSACPMYYVSVLLFFAYCIIWMIFHYFIIQEPYVKMASIQSVATLIKWSALFFIGMHFSFEKTAVLNLVTGFFIIVFWGLMYFTIVTGNVIFIASRFFNLPNDVAVASYQGFSRSALVVAVLLLCLQKSFYRRILTAMAGLFVLFILSARSELYGFLFFCAVYFSVLSLRNVKWFIICVCIGLAAAFFISASIDRLSKSRQLEIVDFEESSSWTERQNLQRIALQQIAENPVFGLFGGHIDATGSKGGYSHNALSAWLNYGLLGFLLYLGLTIIATFHSALYFFKYGPLSTRWTLAFAINSICFLLVIVSKSVFWSLPALGWGLYINAAVYQKRLRSEVAP